MSTINGRWRRRLLAPTEDEVGFAALGFPVVQGTVTRLLEQIPRTVVRGFRAGIDGRGLDEITATAAEEPAFLRGFFHEGAVMAACVTDALDPRPSQRARDLLAGPARPHLLLGWIGVGFALARLPRPL